MRRIYSHKSVIICFASSFYYLAPGEDPVLESRSKNKPTNKKENEKKLRAKPENNNIAPASDLDLPDICKIEFKVGLITKVWAHPDADKLYCEEIDCGEEGGPRQIASGLRHHYSEEDMLGKKVLVVANLKVRILTIHSIVCFLLFTTINIT